MASHPVPERSVVLPTMALTTLSDLVLLELAERGAAPIGVDLTSARQHVQTCSVEDLEDLRERLGRELVDRAEAWARENPRPPR